MPRVFVTLARRLGALAATAVLGGLLTAALVRSSPGFDADERQLDPRLNAESRAQIADERRPDHDVLRFYVHYLAAMLRGDFGTSPSLQQPIAQLIASRLPVTLVMMTEGVAGGWLLAFALLLPCAMLRGRVWASLSGAISVGALCVPSAAVAVLIFSAGGPVPAAIAVVVFPRLFEYLRNLLADAWSRPHILTARAKGLRPLRILVRHVLPVCAPEFLALAGISVTMAFAASIPVETLCDVPGIGQLAWKAAMARDLPLLVTLTTFIVLLTQFCNGLSDWLTVSCEGHRA